MLYEPCLWKIIIDDRVNWMCFHTDDCDGLADEPMPYSLTAAVSCWPLLAFTDQGRIGVRITKFLDQVSRTKDPAEPEPTDLCLPVTYWEHALPNKIV